ncbi:hypothetical protein [Phyllobacterium calauticae]|jgi:hypothetical protein|uniref:hypothetical protein n=1 Tax=Phyllobacterium calauticae TaxID=2817027 RepID=UPI001CBD9D15|nr:hypothetical protein [Phyllobacterium calauticae]MBZ3693254.1 hypothetical protein [Phyllobacterium calauticae]
MHQIEHDNDEPRIDRNFPSPWKYLAVLIAFSAVTYFYANKPDWWALALGGLAGMTLTAWAIEITGNKVPDSWRTKPPR